MRFYYPPRHATCLDPCMHTHAGTDEYQLINFAISFKAVSFVKWGLPPLLTNYVSLYALLTVV